MSHKDKKQPNGELHISQDDLREVLDTAAHLQAKASSHEEISREALEEIAEETGISKEMLARAQAQVAARHQQQQKLRQGAAAVAVIAVVASAPAWWSHVFPGKKLDPITAALQSETLRQEALRLRYEEDYTSAIAKAQQAVQTLPTSPLANNELGLCYEYGGKLAQAQQAYQKAIDVAGTSKDACYPHYNLACMLAKTPLKRDAESHFKDAIARWSDFAPAHNALGKLYEQLGRPQDALASYEDTVKADATYRSSTRNKQAQTARLAHAHKLLDEARDLMQQGKPTDALALAHKAVNRFGRNRMAQREMGLDYDGDPKVMQKLADGFYEEADKLHGEGHRNHDQHAFREAIDHCMAAVEVEPDDFQASFLLAMLYEDLGRHTDAVDAYELAIEMGGPSKDQAHAWAYLGDTYVKLKQPDDAIEAYKQAVATQPSDYYAYDRLGSLYTNLNRQADAQAIYQAGLQRSPGDSHLKADLAGIGGKR